MTKEFAGRGFSEANEERKFERKHVYKDDIQITKRLMKYITPYWREFLLSLILILIVSAASLARPYIVKVAIDSYVKKGISGDLTLEMSLAGIKLLGLVYFLFMITELVLSYFQTYILGMTGKKIIMNLREEIFKHIQKLPISYFDKNSVGKMVTRVTNDTDSLNEMFMDVGVGFIQNIFIMIGIIIVMASLNLNLTIICLLVTPLMFFVALLFREKARVVFAEIRNKLALINSFISENISGIKIIQIFNMEDKKYEEFKKLNKDHYNSSLKQIVLFGIFKPFMDVVKNLSLALILVYGGMGLIKGAIEVGTLYAFINYINRLFQPIIELTDQYNTYQSSIISAERIFNLLDEEGEESPSQDEGREQVEKQHTQGISILTDKQKSGQKMKLGKINGEIEFRNVWFAYEGENWILKDVSFKILKGQSIAFVGTTGAGKTSIVNLICGFYEYQKGEIFVDGLEIKSIRKEDLRRNIGLVLQDVFLFAGDIEDNIKLFNKNITLKEVKTAAEYVNADYFIRNLPNGYNHKISEKGSTISMGQRQLLSFARALVYNPTILVMDEATSNVDTETERLIQEGVENLMKNRTSITVAHRLSTVRNVDKIIVLHKGEVKETGSHEELIKKGGLYNDLYELQYR